MYIKDQPSGPDVKARIPEYFPVNPLLPQHADSLLHRLVSPAVAAQRFEKGNKFEFWRDYQFVQGARQIKRLYTEQNSGSDFFDGTYFIVDTGLAHSIAVGHWLSNNGIDIGIALSSTQKLSGFDRPEIILSLMKDSLKSRTKEPKGFASLLEYHRTDPILKNSQADEIPRNYLIDPANFADMGISKVVVLTESPTGVYTRNNTFDILRSYAQELPTPFYVFGIDEVARIRRKLPIQTSPPTALKPLTDTKPALPPQKDIFAIPSPVVPYTPLTDEQIENFKKIYSNMKTSGDILPRLDKIEPIPRLKMDFVGSFMSEERNTLSDAEMYKKAFSSTNAASFMQLITN